MKSSASIIILMTNINKSKLELNCIDFLMICCFENSDLFLTKTKDVSGEQ